MKRWALTCKRSHHMSSIISYRPKTPGPSKHNFKVRSTRVHVLSDYYTRSRVKRRSLPLSLRKWSFQACGHRLTVPKITAWSSWSECRDNMGKKVVARSALRTLKARKSDVIGAWNKCHRCRLCVQTLIYLLLAATTQPLCSSNGNYQAASR